MIAWSGRRVLVTGAAGFIGANLVAALHRAGAEVHGLVRRSTDRWRLDGLGATLATHECDLTEAGRLAETVREIQPHVVFHAAAAGDHHPAAAADRFAAFRDTVVGTVALTEALTVTSGVRLVYLGSSLEYGSALVPLEESRELAPTTFRGATKAGATLLCRQMTRERGTPVILLRLFSCYGPWESASRFVPTVMRALRTGADLPLTRPGIRRDFVYVDDVIDACLRAGASTSGLGEIINIGSGRQWSNEELAELAQQVTGVRIHVRPGTFPPRPADAGHWVADIEKARTLLGWSPQHSLEQGLVETWRWCGEHAEALAQGARPVDP
jgi:nucleoside-diphosphate-sugar epimerase